jgi:hypothetical protein
MLLPIIALGRDSGGLSSFAATDARLLYAAPSHLCASVAAIDITCGKAFIALRTMVQAPSSPRRRRGLGLLPAR